MRKSILFILPFLISCTPTESIDTHDDVSVLQDLIFNSNLAIKPLDLGEQIWNKNGRIIMLNCDSTGLSGEIPESIGTLTELFSTLPSDLVKNLKRLLTAPPAFCETNHGELAGENPPVTSSNASPSAVTET